MLDAIFPSALAPRPLCWILLERTNVLHYDNQEENKILKVCQRTNMKVCTVFNLIQNSSEQSTSTCSMDTFASHEGSAQHLQYLRLVGLHTASNSLRLLLRVVRARRGKERRDLGLHERELVPQLPVGVLRGRQCRFLLLPLRLVLQEQFVLLVERPCLAAEAVRLLLYPPVSVTINSNVTLCPNESIEHKRKAYSSHRVRALALPPLGGRPASVAFRLALLSRC